MSGVGCGDEGRKTEGDGSSSFCLCWEEEDGGQEVDVMREVGGTGGEGKLGCLQRGLTQASSFVVWVCQ